jgi:hypothetical protein
VPCTCAFVSDTSASSRGPPVGTPSRPTPRNAPTSGPNIAGTWQRGVSLNAALAGAAVGTFLGASRCERPGSCPKPGARQGHCQTGSSAFAVELLRYREGQLFTGSRDQSGGGAGGSGRGHSAGGAAMDRASALHRTAPNGRCPAAGPARHRRHTTSTRVGSNRPPRFADGFTTTASKTDWMMARRCSIARVGQSASTSAGRLVTAT